MLQEIAFIVASVDIMELQALCDDFFIGPFPKYVARRTMQRPLPAEERVVTAGFQARVKPSLSYRLPRKPTVKRNTLSPDYRYRAGDRQPTPTPASASQSPIKQKTGGSPVFVKVKELGNYQSLVDLLTESAIARKCLLVRQSPMLTRPRCINVMRPLTPVAEPKRIEPRRRRLEAEEPRRRAVSIRKEERISVKEAMRDKEWLQKAREGILSSFSSQLLQSNGVALDCSPEPQLGFKYFVGRGNNAPLVRSVLGSRSWWTRVDEDNKEKANLVWTQWLDLDSLEQSQSLKSPISPAVLQASPGQVSTAVRYNPASCRLPFGRLVDLAPLNYDLILHSASFAKQTTTLNLKPADLTTCNKLECNHHLSNKKALFINMRMYYDALEMDPYEHIPLTFHIKEGESEEEFRQFEENFKELAASGCRNIWILKPGENTNRGTGISLCGSVAEVREEMRSLAAVSEGKLRTFILQKYIEKPFLINKRKFDIRLYTLVTAVNGVIQAYFYSEGYLRTSSKEFSLKDISNKLVHLTNDAVQKYSDDYGKFEQGNKLSYSDFQRYLDLHYRESHIDFRSDIVPKMKHMAKDTVQAVFLKLDPRCRVHTFEIFGYDFMLDEDLKPWLIEVNTNPCLELSSSLLARLIPNMLDNALR